MSLHALLAECDSSNFLPPLGPPYFYPRSPCGERRCEPWPPHRTTQFLSTLSLRRATSAQAAFPPGECISIHALLAESDGGSDKYKGQALEFLSTLSLRRATCNNCIFCFCHKISIHALLAESDVSLSIMMQLCEISIHALLAESDFEAGRAGMQAALFLSTLSLRRATLATW